jgi:hypothetical protein
MGHKIRNLYYLLFFPVFLYAESEPDPDILEWIPSALPIETGSIWPRYLGIALLITIIVAILGVVYWFLKYRRYPAAPEIPLSSNELLLDDLKKARQALALPNAGAFAMLITKGIRCYIEREFPHHSRTQTTEEFLQSFQQIEYLDWTTQSSLCEILRLSDQVKFADRELQTQERRLLYRKTSSLALTLCRLCRHQAKEKSTLAADLIQSKPSTISHHP